MSVNVVAIASDGRTRAPSCAASIRAPATGPPLASVTVPESLRPPGASWIATLAVSPAASSRVAAAGVKPSAEALIRHAPGARSPVCATPSLPALIAIGSSSPRANRTIVPATGPLGPVTVTTRRAAVAAAAPRVAFADADAAFAEPEPAPAGASPRRWPCHHHRPSTATTHTPMAVHRFIGRSTVMTVREFPLTSR